VKAIVIVLGLLAAGYQPASTGALPAALRTHVQADRFGIVTSIRGLPLGVRDALQGLFGGALDIAEPGAEFQAGAATSPLPSRRLVAAGCSPDHHCLVYYQRGGAKPAWHVAMFQWTPDATRFEWGGTAPAGLAALEDVRKAILSGAIKGPVKDW
jgi:hypothetical protein